MSTGFYSQQTNMAPHGQYPAQHAPLYPAQQQCYQPQYDHRSTTGHPPLAQHDLSPQSQYHQHPGGMTGQSAPTPGVTPRQPKVAPTAHTYTHSPYAQSFDSSDNRASNQEYFSPSPSNFSAVADSPSTSSCSSVVGHDDRYNSCASDNSSEADLCHRTPTPSDDGQSSDYSEKRQQGGVVNITVEIINSSVGKITTIASSPHGSSFLQAALRQYPIEAFEVTYKEVAPQMGKLLQDKHACYVVKMVLEMMDKDEALAQIDTIAANEELLLALCTKDLHSRRMIQFILDFAGNCGRFFNLVMTRPMQIVRTQQGCITLQRILDHFTESEKETYFAAVRANFMEYALDPFGNYIIQYMLTEGNQVENSNTLALYCRGQLHNMICHKYASNVIEKCFGLVTPELQHEIIEEMFNAPEPTLMRVLTDSSANYVVQAAIRSASFRDVTLINNRIGTMLPNIQFGKKLQQRLARRLKH